MTVAGDYAFNITVSDGSRTTSRQVKVPVLAGNQPPVVGSATNKNPVNLVLPTTTTTLSGGGYDLEGDWWMLESSPADSTVTFYEQGQPETDVWADTAGTCKFRLVVVDRTLYAESSQVTLNLPATARPVDGDINADGGVDVIDLLYFVDSFGRFWGEDGFNRHCDFNGDGGVDVIDLLTLVENWPA